MRRKEKEIKEQSEIEAIINSSLVCRLGLSDGNIPYIVPLCFGFKERSIYIHSALKGRKIDILKINPNVCFEFDSDIEVKKTENPCNWGMKFKSVIGFGKAVFIEDIEEKKEALNIIMHQYSGNSFDFSDNVVNGVAVIRIDIEEITGKWSGL
ncbi:MAG: pyridoxamine 5'-phosphate oxidase family protein [Desulfamplus sp.]|nr:pyridoxamine 5'-phosphate oxidase family protein [Desulfamplus sp.]